ncbi:hypothetical protein Q4508_09510 [Amphritea sp. 2_MG-2023]|uniref:hypothetical protein n=1 Tax=Amphritea TaxID=515417 RepID=UPI001C06A98B|nr:MULTISPECIES: hypothetical protein [Amphritea]MBU2965009.1 hypothetical protein [Amphritea atlantica]MDO6418794.1 hypothetical protein [Amphritea sp. 2_MG-2023]
MNKIIVLMLLLLSNACSAGLRMEDGSLIRAGDNIALLHARWGKEDMRLTSERTCNHIIQLKRRYCSSLRLVWRRDGRYILVQVSGRMIIKTGWTRSKRVLKEAL